MFRTAVLVLFCAGAAPSAAMSIQFFSDGSTYKPSNIATRSASTVVCESMSEFTSLSCAATFTLLGGYTSESGFNYANAVNPQTGGAFSSTMQIQGPTGIVIAANWSALWGRAPQASMYAAGVIASGTSGTTFWTGTLPSFSLARTALSKWLWSWASRTWG